MSENHSTLLFDVPPEKLCPKCKAVLPLDSFGKIKGVHRSYCRTCHKSAMFVPDLRKEKACAHCKAVKPIAEFNRSGKRYQSFCRKCGEKVGTEARRIKKENGESVIINRKDYLKRNMWRKMRAKYGIDREQYEALVEAQGNACAICKKPEKEMDGQRGTPLRLSVDHDHETGKVRGLLCRQCNIGIGRLKESVEILQNAIDYLKSHS